MEVSYLPTYWEEEGMKHLLAMSLAAPVLAFSSLSAQAISIGLYDLSNHPDGN
jgi:hypothetical protein